MEFWARLFGRRAQEREAGTETPAPAEASAAAPSGATPQAPIAVSVGPRCNKPYHIVPSNDFALAVATVYRCVDVLSSSVASLTFRYLRLKDGCFVEETASGVNYLLSVQPQPEMSAMDFWSLAVTQMLLDGNAYIYPRYIMGELTDLVLCRNVAHDDVNGLYRIHDQWSGVSGTFPEEAVIHLYLHTRDGRHGISVLEHARQTLGIATTANDETESRFGNGGMPRGLVTNDRDGRVGFGEYDDGELRNTAVDVADQLRVNGIAALPGQAGFVPLTMSSSDMQFLETSKFTVREICRFFGVHPSFVFDDGSANYKSAEMANVAFLSMTLNPILRRIENEFTRKLVRQQDAHRRKFEFDRSGIYSLDLITKADYYMRQLSTGAFTVNNIRHFENLPPVSGGDILFVSANLKPLTEAGVQVEPPQPGAAPQNINSTEDNGN